jgi:hypothetical protein
MLSPVYLFLTAYRLAALGVGLLYLVFLRTPRRILELTSKLVRNVSFHVLSNSLLTTIQQNDTARSMLVISLLNKLQIDK